MKAFAVAGVLILVLVAGIMDWLNRNDHDAPANRIIRLWEEDWQEGNYSVPKCAQSWPPTCPGSQKTQEVPECAQSWPTTCKEENE